MPESGMDRGDPAPPIEGASEEPVPYVPLQKLPFPRFVQATLAATVLLFVLAALKAPAALEDGIAYEHAKKAMSDSRPKDAVEDLGRLLARYPLAQDVRKDTVRARTRTGDLQGAVEALRWFEGKEFSDETIIELNLLADELDAAIGRADTTEIRQ